MKLRMIGAGGRTLLVFPGVLFLSALFLLPLGTVVVIGLIEGQQFGEAYQRVWQASAYTTVILRTFEVSFYVTIMTAVLGYVFALRIYTARPILKAVLILALLFPFWTNPLIRAFGWFLLLKPSGLVNTFLIDLNIIGYPIQLVPNPTGMYIALVQVMLPFMTLPTLAAMMKVDVRLLDAAESLGASPLRSFTAVFFRLSLSGAASGAALVFIVTLGAYSIPAMLGGTRGQMLSQVIESNINTTLEWGIAAALATILLVLTMLLLSVTFKWIVPANLRDR